MKVTVKDITEKFDALLEKTETRESIAEFAQHAMEADDIGDLDMEDGADEKIWKSLVYLSGVDLMDEPGIYLHVDDDFLAARRSLGV